MTRYPAQERWRQLPRDVTREEYFRVLEDAVREYYLADSTNPYQQSGRSSGAARWEETRRPYVKALHRNGDFLDVGCANGLLLETLGDWARQAGIVIQPHGIDLLPELVDLARRRFPGRDDCFEVANAYDWVPKRRYDFVRTSLEYVPEADWLPFLRRHQAAVAPGGRLIVSHYHNPGEHAADTTVALKAAGFTVAGSTGAPGVSIAWCDL